MLVRVLSTAQPASLSRPASGTAAAAAAKPNAVEDKAEVLDTGDSPTSQAVATPTTFGKVARDKWRTRSLQRQCHVGTSVVHHLASKLIGLIFFNLTSLLRALGVKGKQR
jgi:hypothetical protein